MRWSWVKGLAVYDIEDVLAGLTDPFQARCSDTSANQPFAGQSWTGLDRDPASPVRYLTG